MRNTVLLFLLILGLGGCEFFALSFAPAKEPLKDNSELANQASKEFWKTFHQGDYNNISKPMTLLKAAYLQNPYDAKIKGGCIIIYGEIRSGFSPLPSRGGISFFMNGFMKS